MNYNKELSNVLNEGITLIVKEKGLTGRFESYGRPHWDCGAYTYWIEESWIGGRRFRLELWRKYDHVQAESELDEVFFI